mgnify:FL=1
MSEKIVQLNEEVIKGQLKELVRGSVEETLNELLEVEAEKLTQAARYERSEVRHGYRSGHYDRNLTTTSGDIGAEETLPHCGFFSAHWTRIRTNNVIERLNREIRRRTRVVGAFPDRNSALMLVCARLRHVAGTQWGNKKYMNMKHLDAAFGEAELIG